jgi:hypothetical protein
MDGLSCTKLPGNIISMATTNGMQERVGLWDVANDTRTDNPLLNAAPQQQQQKYALIFDPGPSEEGRRKNVFII